MAMAIAAIVSRRRALLPFLLSPSPLPLLHFPFSSSSSSSSASSPSFPFKPTIPTSPDPETSDFEPDPPDPDGSDLPEFLQLLSHAKSLSSSRKDALALLRSSSGVERSRALVRRALWDLRWDWEAAMLALRWGEECVLDCPAAWHLAIWAMGKQGRFDMAWSVVRRMHKRSILTQRAMVIMMERYAAANEPGKAIKTFHAMDKFKISSDLTAFYSLLHALCKNKNVEEAEELLLVNKKFFPLSAEGFNIILDGWCNIMTDITEAKRVWREMASCCITPDGTSYTHMIRCFSKVSNLFDSLRLYDEMKKRGWTPDLAAYNSLVYVLTRENCLRDAQNLFSKILDEGLQPTVETFNCMIYPLCESHKLDEARMVMEDMMVKGISPDIETYHAFIKEEGIDETLKILRRMRDARCGPNRYTFLLVFDKYFGLNESENALRMWSEMRKHGINPDLSHYIVLVEGLVKHGWMPKALEFHNEMKDRGFVPDPKFEKVFKEFIENNKDHWGRVGKDYIISQRGKRSSLRGAAVQ